MHPADCVSLRAVVSAGKPGDEISLTFPACIDYVIVHESCHLKEHQHGPAFVTLLDRLMPDWRDRREQLNTEL